MGFEDTPDYDYLRDLFTQALKNLGEVEDGEYDWMKLNNGKGWEAISKHPSSNQYHHHGQGNHQTGTAAELRHGQQGTRGPSQAQLTAARLNAAQPPPPSPAMPMKRERQNVSNAQPIKRPSGAAGGLQPGVSTPTASTQAQFQTSQTNLPPARTQMPVNNQHPPAMRNPEPKKTAWQKISSLLCCGM